MELKAYIVLLLAAFHSATAANGSFSCREPAGRSFLAKWSKHAPLTVMDPPKSMAETLTAHAHANANPFPSTTHAMSASFRAALALRGGDNANAASAPSILFRVMKVHRFIALFYGLVLIFAPDQATPGVDIDGYKSITETLALRGWGSFILGVAYIVHSAVTNDGFSESARVEIAKGLFGTFVVATGAGVHTLVTQKDISENDRKAITQTAFVTGALATAYGVGIAGA
mmetsp:Transcript_38674/g.81319  ORF Transcript_38674/g.81319 Transcript_38674/m.81319 type:complete len:229 (-) Transcript_38674:262-948(-)